MNKLKGLNVAILAADGVEQVELVEPRKALEDEGAKTFLISPEKNSVQAWNHTEKGDKFPVDCSLDDAFSKDYDALLLPGGVINPDRLRTFSKAITLVEEMNGQKKPIAAICHGPWLLINAGVVNGVKVTSWISIKTDLINAGAQWVDAAAICDNNILTSRKPEDIPQFNKAMLGLFESQRES